MTDIRVSSVWILFRSDYVACCLFFRSDSSTGGFLILRPARGQTGFAFSSAIQINGVEDVLVRFGKCCNPLPGDEITGFITRGRGVTVHTIGCEKALTQDPARRVDVTWDVKGDLKRPVSVKVVTSDTPGMLAKVSQTFSEAGINIASANVRGHGERAVLSFEVSVQDLKQLTSVMRSIERIDGVHSVERV